MPRRGSAILACVAFMLIGPFLVTDALATESGTCRTGGPQLRYLVLFDEGTPEQDATDETGTACGELIHYYPGIAVGVATSTNPEFGTRIGPDRHWNVQQEQRMPPRASGIAPEETPERPSTPAVLENPEADHSAEQWALRTINGDAAHTIESGSREVVVGVLDSGIDARHPDLTDALDPELSAGCLSGVPDPSPEAWTATGSAHGTHVAGILAAADNGRGITGIAPGVRLASMKVIDDQGYVTPEAAICGLLWAARHDMAVVNSSFHVSPWPIPCTSSGQVVHEALARAVEFADARGTLTVAAATNDAARLTPSPGSGAAEPESADTCEALPAGLPEVVAVSAVDRDGVKAGYSSHGLGVIDLTAPGGDHGECVLSTVPGGYGSMCGTSMAAPHVTGVAALLASRNPDATPAQLRTALTEHVRPVSCPGDYDLTGTGTQDAYCTGYTGYNSFYGHGLVDAFAAVTGA